MTNIQQQVPHLFNIIQESWEASIDPYFKEQFSGNEFLCNIVCNFYKYNPYNTYTDSILGTYYDKMGTIPMVFEEKDSMKAYQNLHFFTQLQANLVWIIETNKKNLRLFELVTEYYEESTKVALLDKFQGEVEQRYALRKQEIEEIYKAYPDKKGMTTNEAKYISNLINGVDDEVKAYTSLRLGTKANNTISSKINADLYFIELKRKKEILESVVSYFDRIWKSCQEQINTSKKTIENLNFLYERATV